jgi:hypothetical protein
MSKSTPLGEAQITGSSHNTITVELIEPVDMPTFVRVTWPQQPTVLDPTRFGDSAAVIVRMFSEAHVKLARIKARRL